MRKVWNRETRQYDWQQEGIWVDQQDYDVEGAWQKWVSRRGPRAGRSHVVKAILNRMIRDGASYSKHHEFIEAIENAIVEENHENVARYLGKQNKKIEYSSIPMTFRPAIASIVRGDGAMFYRSMHTSRPSINAGVGQVKEYHLTAQQDGRATTAVHNGMLFVYYSTTHAAATYNYHLVTMRHGAIEVPLVGGKRDEIIQWPF